MDAVLKSVALREFDIVVGLSVATVIARLLGELLDQGTRYIDTIGSCVVWDAGRV